VLPSTCVALKVLKHRGERFRHRHVCMELLNLVLEYFRRAAFESTKFSMVTEVRLVLEYRVI
jgi:hypothetical protein